MKKVMLAIRLKSNLPTALLAVCSGLILLLLAIYTFSGSIGGLHSDSASQVTMALEILRKHSPFPENWIGATAIPVNPYIIVPLLWAGATPIQAKLISQFALICLMAVAVWLFAKKGLGSRSWVLMIPCLFTYTSDITYDILYVQCAYTVQIAIILVVLALLCRNLDEQSILRMQDYKLYWLLVGGMLISCTLGVMYLQAIYLPALGTLLYLYIEKNKHCPVTTLSSEWKKFALRVIGIAMAGVLGYLFSIKLSQLTAVVGNESLTLLASSAMEVEENVSKLVQGIFLYAGFEGGVSLFSVAGILTVIRFCFFIFFTVVAPVLAYRKISTESIRMRGVMVFTLIHSILVLLILLFTGMPDGMAAARYMITSFLLLQLIGIHYIYTNYIQSLDTLSYVYAVGASVTTLAMMLPIVLAIPNGAAILEQQKGVTNFLLQNGLEYGYATYWNANVNTVLSNGGVQINAVLISEGQVSPYYWITSTDWYKPEYYDGDTFLMLSSEELAAYTPNGYAETVIGEPQKVLTFGDYTILVYDYNISQNDFTGKMEGGGNLLPKMFLSNESMKQEDGSIQVLPGQLLFGPYMSLDRGKYLIEIDADCESEQQLRITANSGQKILLSTSICTGTNEITFSLDELTHQVEFVIDNVSVPVQLTRITLEKEL